MPLIKNDIPILEYSTGKKAVFDPPFEGVKFPKRCVMTFFGEVLDNFVAETGAEKIGHLYSEIKDYPVYKTTADGKEICLIHAAVGSSSIAILTDWLFAQGVEILTVCGSCGVLDDIPAGAVIVPVKALRDEGASYKYLPPSRFIELNKKTVGVMEDVLTAEGVRFTECATWTTDGFYRETADMVEYRKSEGCKVVEMECAGLAAIAEFRGETFGQLLYSGDILFDTENYDARDFLKNSSARELLFRLTLKCAAAL